MKKTHTLLSSVLLAVVTTLGFAGCTAGDLGGSESDAPTSESDALSLAEQKLAEPDAQLLRAFLEGRGYELDVDRATLEDVGNTAILGIPFAKAGGAPAQIAFALEGNQATRTVMALLPVGDNLPDELYMVADGAIVETHSVAKASGEEPYTCCTPLVAFGCWLSCQGTPNPNPCCASNCCCNSGLC